MVIVHVHGDIDVFVEVQVETCHRTEQVEGCFEAGCIIRVTPKEDCARLIVSKRVSYTAIPKKIGDRGLPWVCNQDPCCYEYRMLPINEGLPLVLSSYLPLNRKTVVLDSWFFYIAKA